MMMASLAKTTAHIHTQLNIFQHDSPFLLQQQQYSQSEMKKIPVLVFSFPILSQVSISHSFPPTFFLFAVASNQDILCFPDGNVDDGRKEKGNAKYNKCTLMPPLIFYCGCPTSLIFILGDCARTHCNVIKNGVLFTHLHLP